MFQFPLITLDGRWFERPIPAAWTLNGQPVGSDVARLAVGAEVRALGIPRAQWVRLEEPGEPPLPYGRRRKP